MGLLFAVLLLKFGMCVDGANLVLSWNDVVLDAIRFNKSSPPISSRALAIVGVAVHDALASVSTRYNPHAYAISDAPENTSLEAVVVAAARTSLAALYPNQVATFDDKYFSDLASLGNSLAVSNGIYVGTAVANAVLVDRENDGYTPYLPYPGSDAPGKWRPTPPNFALAEVPQWSALKPWCMTSDSEFRPPPPPSIDGATYAADHNQIALLGSKFNSTRTQEQSDIASFWYDGPATDTPPGTWDTVSDHISIQKGYDLVDSAYLGALVGMALADCAIMGWDAKYTYGQWRPITAIRFANMTGNQGLFFNPLWEPLLSTPNWPDYISDRAMFGGAASQLLGRIFGDNFIFSIVSDALGTTRTYRSFSSAAFEEGQSRVFGGSHFNTSCVLGVEYGKKVADWSYDHCIRPRAGGTTVVVTAPTSTASATTPSLTGNTNDYTSVIVGAVIGGTLGIIFLILFAIFVFSSKRGLQHDSSSPISTRHDFDGVELSK
jgi:hypothetical protein